VASGNPLLTTFRFQVWFTGGETGGGISAGFSASASASASVSASVGGGGIGFSAEASASASASIGIGASAGGDDTAIADAGFSEVSGLEATIELKSHAEGGMPEGQRQLLGRTTFGNLILKRGLGRNFELYRWFDSVSRGVRPVARKDAMIELLDGDGTDVVARWYVTRAVPIKMKISDLNAKSGEIAIEEIHLAHEGLAFDLALGAG
jgi:phage tail-like protein